jgi:hypothetical protein
MPPQLKHNATWLARLKRVSLQEPLIETRPTLAALQRAEGSSPPKAIFVGLGICSRRQMSRALPVDVLGMLLPAERLRRAAGASTLVAVVADEHALSNNFEAYLVKSRAQSTVRTLERVRESFLDRMQILTASSFHGTDDYRSILAAIERNAPGGEHPYFLREAADIEYLHRRFDGILKVGWSIGPSIRNRRKLDELAFDRRFRSWVGRHVGFVYCKAGRTLDRRQPKMAPYVALDPRLRICLDPGDDVAGKLELARRTASTDVIRGVRNHLRRIARAFDGLIEPLPGTVEQRIQAIITRSFQGRDGAATVEAMEAAAAGRCMTA